MFCVACMIFANDVARKCAIALFFMCMICGYDVVEQFAIALPYNARSKKIQRNVRTCLFSNMARICFV